LPLLLALTNIRPVAESVPMPVTESVLQPINLMVREPILLLMARKPILLSISRRGSGMQLEHVDGLAEVKPFRLARQVGKVRDVASSSWTPKGRQTGWFPAGV
jgi:hypothetical protein